MYLRSLERIGLVLAEERDLLAVNRGQEIQGRFARYFRSIADVYRRVLFLPGTKKKEKCYEWFQLFFFSR